MSLECGCPESYPSWDGVDIDLGGQAILRLPTPNFLHMPISIEAYMGKQRKMIEQLGLEEPWPGFTLNRTGWFRGQLTRLVEDTTSPSRHVSRLPAPFNIRARVHNGLIDTIRKTMRQIQAELLDSGRIPKELYLSYLTCPRCADKRGGEKILLTRRWEESTTLTKRIKKQKS